MPNLPYLMDRVQEIIKDPSYDKYLIDLFNEAMYEIAGSEYPLILLPELETEDTVTTSTTLPYVDLPSDYHRHLYAVKSDQDDDAVIGVVKSLRQLQKMYGVDLDEPGRIQYVTIRGNKLYYQPIDSTANVLTLYYYKLPTEFTANDSDDITVIPNEWQVKLLVNHVVARYYGIRNEWERENRFQQKYEEALERFSADREFGSKMVQTVYRQVRDY